MGGSSPCGAWRRRSRPRQEFRQAIEWLGRRIEAALGGVENTCNIDRVLRLPFTINHPNRLKIKQGRVPAMSDILAETGRRYSWCDLDALAAHLEDEPVANAIPVVFKRRPGNGAAAGGAYQGSAPGRRSRTMPPRSKSRRSWRTTRTSG